MRITRNQLRRIIQEELREQSENEDSTFGSAVDDLTSAAVGTGSSIVKSLKKVSSLVKQLRKTPENKSQIQSQKSIEQLPVQGGPWTVLP